MSDEPPIQGRITNKAGKGDKPRYIRPVERQRMRPWLISHLDSNDIPGLEWQDRKEKVFRISWKHAANQCFNMQKDTNLFERWAIHTGRHHDSDHKRWKANFRCALNSLPDVREHKKEGIKKGNNAFKVYRFLDDKETKANKELKGRKKKEPPDGETEEETGYRDHSYADYQQTGTDSPRLEHFSGGLRFMDTNQTQKLRPLPGHLDDPNLQEILAAATASLAAGSDAVSLEKISIEQLSRLGELSMMKLELREASPDSESHKYVYLCTWCDKVFPSKIEIFKHFLMSHQARLLSGETYKPAIGPDVSDPKYQKLQKEIEVLEKEVFSFTPGSYQASPDDVDNEEVVAITSSLDAENQALDLSVKSTGNQSAKQDVALDLSMNSTKTHKSPKTVQSKQTSKRRRSSLEIDYTVKFGNYGLAGMPRTKRQMSLHTRKKEEEEEKLAKKQSVDVDSVEGASQRSAEDLVHAEILMSLQSAAEDVETSNDSSSVKIKRDTGKGKKGKAAHKKHIVNLEKVIDDVAKRGSEEGEKKTGEEMRKGKLSSSKLNLTAFRCGLCLRKFDDAAVLNSHVEEHKQAEKVSPIIRLKPDPVISAESPGYMYFRQKTRGNIQTIWKCQISSSSGASNVYVCGICQKNFDSLSAINEHEKCHAKSETKDDAENYDEETTETKDLEVIEKDKTDRKDGKKDDNEEKEMSDKIEMDFTSTGIIADQEVITEVQIPVDPLEETDSGEKIETEGVVVSKEPKEELVTAIEDVEVMDTSESITIVPDSVTSLAELKDDGGIGGEGEVESHIVSGDSEKENGMKEIGKEAHENTIDGYTSNDLNEDSGVDKEVTVVTEAEHTKASEEDKEPSDKMKIVQCNVPAFLEVSAEAEGYGIKEEDGLSEDAEKKIAGLDFVNCGICNKKLKLQEIKAHLENHDTEMEQSGKLFEACIICKKMIASKDVNEHLKAHSVLELSLAKNILVHNQNQLKKQLVVHKQFVKDAEAKGEVIKMFVCNLCDKGFEDCASLAEHVEKHLKASDIASKSLQAAEDDSHAEADTDPDSGTESNSRKKKRKLVKPEEYKNNKKPKVVEDKVVKEAETESVNENGDAKKHAALVGTETSLKKNSILAAALNSAPKYGTSLPKTLVKETTESSQSSDASLSTDTNNLKASSSEPVLLSSSATVTTVSSTAESDSISNTVTSSQQQLHSSSDSEGSAQKDSMCLKFPMVLLKPNSEPDTSKLESTPAVSTPVKQNMSVPVVLVRQENQELKLVPMSSVLNLCSTGKATDGSTSFFKLASPSVNTGLSVKKSLTDLPQKTVTMTRPPILYAPVPAAKSGSVVPNLSAAKIGGTAPFPVNLIANQSVLGMFGLGKSIEQSVGVQQKVKQADPIVTTPTAKVESVNKVPGMEGKTKSQNIIAKLLDSKGKLAPIKLPTVVLPGKSGDEVGEANSKSVNAEVEVQESAVVSKCQPIPLSGVTNVPVKMLATEQANPSSQQQPLLIFKTCATSTTSITSTADSVSVPKVSSDLSTSLSSTGTTEKNAIQEVPAKLGRPPIHGNKALVLHGHQVSTIVKSKMSTTMSSVRAPLNPAPSAQFSSPSSSSVNLAAVRQQSFPVVTGTPTVSPGVQLQPNLVNMMLQQLILSQASQVSVTSTSTVTSPKPTFNLVFAPQTVLPSVVTSAPGGVVTRPQLPVGVTNTTGQSQSLILVCKGCNQSLDSIGLMGSHVCPKSPTSAPGITIAPANKKKVTLYKCAFCSDNTFTDSHLYAQHVKSHLDKVHKGRTPQLACPLCREIFKEEESVTLHMEEKHPDGHIKCKYCDKRLVGRTEYELHVLYDHPWQCNKCFHRFSTLSQLNSHVTLDFKSLPPLTCNKCNLYFPSIEAIVTHVGSSHPEGDSVLNCTKEELLNAYLQKSKSTCWCTCNECDAGFKTIDYMMSHLQKVHFTKVIFMCGMCKENKRLPLRSSLEAHQHFGGTRKRELQFCYQCCLLFPNKSQFNKHMNVHQNHVTDTTKSKLKSVLKDKAKSFETDVAKSNSDEIEASDTDKPENHNCKNEETVVDHGVNSASDNVETQGKTEVKDQDMEVELFEGTCEDLVEVKGDTDETKEESVEAKVEAVDVEVFKCKDCSLGPFKSKYQLKQHKVIKHMYPRSSTSTSYYQHVIENLKRPKGFECGKCERRFERQTSLFRHQLSHGTKRYQCLSVGCKLKFGSLHRFKEHQRKCRSVRKRTGIKKVNELIKNPVMKYTSFKQPGDEILGNFANVYLCKLCDKDCESLSRLKEHLMQEHTNELCQCDLCKFVCLKEEDLKNHKNDCHGDLTWIEVETEEGATERKRPNRTVLFGCRNCQESFIELSTLKHHVIECNAMTNNRSPLNSDCGDLADKSSEIDVAKSDIETNRTEDRSGNIETNRTEDRSGDIETNRTEDRSGELVNPYLCLICKEAFSDSDEYFQHVIGHTELSDVDTVADEKLLHTSDMDETVASGSETQGGTDTENGTTNSNKVVNAVICNQCTKIVYFEEDRLCENVLNHNCNLYVM